MKKVLLATIIMGISSGVMADVNTSESKVTDTYKVHSTCSLTIDGKDKVESFGDTFTAKLTTNVKEAGRKIDFAVSGESAELGTVTVVSATDGSTPYKNDVPASSDVAFKMKSDVADLTKIEAGTYEATVTVTATCTI